MHILEYENYEETKKHYDTDFSYNTYPCSIPLDFPCVPLHWHRETEIIYVKSGRGMVNVDGISYPVVKDSIVFILPGRLHSIAQYESEAFSYENIIFDMQMLIPKEGDTMSFNFFHRLQNFPEDFPVLIDRVPKAHRAVQICLDRIDDLRTTYPAGYYLGIKFTIIPAATVVVPCVRLFQRKCGWMPAERMCLMHPTSTWYLQFLTS